MSMRSGEEGEVFPRRGEVPPVANDQAVAPRKQTQKSGIAFIGCRDAEMACWLVMTEVLLPARRHGGSTGGGGGEPFCWIIKLL